jgi:hypothetical protein
MQLKLETWFDYFIIFIFFIKIVFVVSAIGHIILSHSVIDKTNKIDPKLLYWKERTEFIFIISMAILLIYEFNPRLQKKPIGQETRLLFFLFGCVLILTAKWNLFITESPWYKKIVSNLD